MLSNSSPDRAIAFLNHQMNEMDERLAKLQGALESTEESSLEANSLRASLHNNELERDLLGDLLMGQMHAQPLSLDAAIMQRVEQYRREANRLAAHWQRGQETPSAYWDVEVQQSFLTELLSRFHAYDDDPKHAEGRASARAAAAEPEPLSDAASFPWFCDPAQEGRSAAPEMNRLREDLYSALRRGGLPFDHLELWVETNGDVILTGYAHDEDERQEILRTVASVEGVYNTVSDLKIAQPDACPICDASGKP